VTLEIDIETEASDRLLNEYGIPSVKLNMVGNSGWPDRIYVLPKGKLKWVEYKRPGKKPSPKQRFVHRLLKAFGHDVSTYDTVESAVAGVSRALGT
jgi:hypothetical protein